MLNLGPLGALSASRYGKVARLGGPSVLKDLTVKIAGLRGENEELREADELLKVSRLNQKRSQ